MISSTYATRVSFVPAVTMGTFYGLLMTARNLYVVAGRGRVTGDGGLGCSAALQGRNGAAVDPR